MIDNARRLNESRRVKNQTAFYLPLAFIALASCSSMVTVKVLPGNDISIMHGNSVKGKGEATFEVSDSLFEDYKLTFLSGDRVVARKELERRISPGLLVAAFFVWVPIIWALPPRQQQLFDVSGYLTGQPPASANAYRQGFNDLVVLKNGARYSGVKAAVTGDSVVVLTADGKSLVFPKADVQSLTKGN